MDNKKHIAMRTCIATGEKKDKRQMLRLVCGLEGTVEIDIKGKMKGTGANISKDINALDIAIKKGSIERALRLKRKLSEEEVDNLKKDFLKVLDEIEFRSGNKKVTIKVAKGLI